MSANLSVEERRKIEKEAFEKIVQAYGAIMIIRDHYGSAAGHDEIDKILERVEIWAKNRPQNSGIFAIHGAIALRAWISSPISAQSMYEDLGKNLISKYLS